MLNGGIVRLIRENSLMEQDGVSEALLNTSGVAKNFELASSSHNNNNFLGGKAFGGKTVSR